MKQRSSPTDIEARFDALADVASAVQAHLEWEQEWSTFESLPRVTVAPVAARAPVAASTASTAAPAAAPAPGAVPSTERVQRLLVLAEQAASCTACRLHQGRTKSVFARGNPSSEIVFVGEGPGFNEDQEGLPFVGQAGQLLDKMIIAMGYGRDDVYICNVVKCRPPENRAPLPDEASACATFLTEQLDVVAPRVIVALGRSAGQGLGCFTEEARGWRGKWTEWRGIPVMSTYHPAYLLRSPEMKRPVWEDLQNVMKRLRA